MNAQSLIPVLAASLNSCIGNLLLKWSRTSLPANAGLADKFLSIGFIGGLAFYGISVVLFAKALDSMEVSVAYPILAGSGFAMLAVTSSYIFGEPFHLHKWIGLGLVLAGIIFLARGD
ncbi:QacE family quaternary ammonium compound efflux SMR transporter [Bradyrhizobium sp. CSA112]|uniref:DMT family transporter n=1 Tax=Bradyrhizobium sp. CSA112 TaxID=2699170 RepID=UPI0023B016B2|nr:SMR family transporter [Bradyrhizobium sp. CSA112]MDE5457545.1 QacE family quaternary ammonium compound efflux SMR transporter [Bradyrhizobium sp. CSA112]